MMQAAGATYPSLTANKPGPISLRYHNNHVKSFHRPGGVDATVQTNPHMKNLLPGCTQVLAGSRFVMSQGTTATPRVTNPIDPLIHPFVLHFRDRSLTDFIRKKNRGTGGTDRLMFMTLYGTVSEWFQHHRKEEETPLSEAYVSMVAALNAAMRADDIR
jgi:hypothetical protein